LAKGDPLDILAREIGPRFADYRRRWDLAKSFQEIPPFPLHVDYELKSLCNLRCPMCPMATRQGPPDPQTLSLSQTKALIDEGAENGQASMGFGGLWEPLTSKDLPELIAHGRRKGLLEAMFNTNGLLLDAKTSQALIEAGLTRLMVSLDAATPETYAQMRPGSDFRQVEENIMAFLAARRKAKSTLPLLRLSFCLTKLNQPELPAFLERWHNKADFFSLQSYGRFDDSAPALFPEARGPAGPSDRTVPVAPPSGRCAQPFKRLMVRHDLTVLPCCDLSGLTLTLGRADQGLSQIWQSLSLAALRQKLKDSPFDDLPEACQKCQRKFQPPNLPHSQIPPAIA
jgi:MoaA/NifB/PqqE/SkfB family radical SAM enzyme